MPESVEPDAAARDDDALRARIVKALRSVHDPEIPVNVHDLGLIYGLDISAEGAINVRMTLTAPNCPMAEMIVQQVGAKVREVDGVASAQVELVWEPKWDASMMSEAAKLELEFTGHTGPAHLRPDGGRDRLSQLTVGRSKPRPRPRD